MRRALGTVVFLSVSEMSSRVSNIETGVGA